MGNFAISGALELSRSLPIGCSNKKVNLPFSTGKIVAYQCCRAALLTSELQTRNLND